MAERITDKLVKALEPPTTGNRITYDTEVKGFGVRVTAAGAKAFILNYRVAGRERRFTIGSYPDWSVAAAREEAKELKRRVDQGQDPLGKRIEERTAPTVNDLWLAYEEHHLPKKRPRAAADDRSMWQTYILPRLGSEKVADITPQDADALHAWISQTKPVRANRVIEVLKAAMNLAIRWKWRTDNPAMGVHRNYEDRRQRHLSPKEMVALSEAMEVHREKASCDAIRLMLLTGARKTEVLAATWSMFDLDEGIWTKPSAHTKQKKTHRVPLSSAAIELLRRIKAEGADPVFVFPSSVPGKPLSDIKRTWAALCAKAEIKDCRIHDLRHTFASVLASNNLGLPIIGALLGHTQAQTTQRYAHLFDDPLRAAADAVGQTITKKDRKHDVAAEPH